MNLFICSNKVQMSFKRTKWRLIAKINFFKCDQDVFGKGGILYGNKIYLFACTECKRFAGLG